MASGFSTKTCLPAAAVRYDQFAVQDRLRADDDGVDFIIAQYVAVIADRGAADMLSRDRCPRWLIVPDGLDAVGVLALKQAFDKAGRVNMSDAEECECFHAVSLLRPTWSKWIMRGAKAAAKRAKMARRVEDEARLNPPR